MAGLGFSRGAAHIHRAYLAQNIDTDQIIPAEYLTLVPSKPEEYEKLGSYALIGLPDDLYPERYVKEGEMKTEYPVIIGGAKVCVAESYARIFFRNCIATGELYPCETGVRLCDVLKTGTEVTVDMDKNVLTDHSTGKTYPLQEIGEAGPVIDAGGIFEYARRQGMIKVA
ncbi:LEU1S protein [Gonium pectorale]|uniref:LEU1S protein n=1 Tax=Gonium pectorale TaxID=33097 RepID=A0A150H4T1_GONPE|nr:LEU1S protein [Gonium pectorale]|eukprot:KXZ57044.1 LEU1S protein [Gonium pectorale]